jgi:hypothetical protein
VHTSGRAARSIQALLHILTLNHDGRQPFPQRGVILSVYEITPGIDAHRFKWDENSQWFAIMLSLLQLHVCFGPHACASLLLLIRTIGQAAVRPHIRSQRLVNKINAFPPNDKHRSLPMHWLKDESTITGHQ